MIVIEMLILMKVLVVSINNRIMWRELRIISNKY